MLIKIDNKLPEHIELLKMFNLKGTINLKLSEHSRERCYDRDLDIPAQIDINHFNVSEIEVYENNWIKATLKSKKSKKGNRLYLIIANLYHSDRVLLKTVFERGETVKSKRKNNKFGINSQSRLN